MRKRLRKKHFVFKLQKNARRGDAFASDCSSWKTYKELGCTINKKESNRPVSMASDEPNSAFERDSSKGFGRFSYLVRPGKDTQLLYSPRIQFHGEFVLKARATKFD